MNRRRRRMPEAEVRDLILAALANGPKTGREIVIGVGDPDALGVLMLLVADRFAVRHGDLFLAARPYRRPAGGPVLAVIDGSPR